MDLYELSRLPLAPRREALRLVPGVGRTQHFNQSFAVSSSHSHIFGNLLSDLPHPVAIVKLGGVVADYNPSLLRCLLMDRSDISPPASFEDAQAELDELVRAMETGQMPLDRLLDAYKRGAQLLEFCRSRLDAVEEQVKVLEEGQLKPWTRP